MRTLEIKLSEEQYQHIQEEIQYGGRKNLEEETMGGYEITLHVGVPNIYTYLEMNYINKIDLGEVEWSFKNLNKQSSDN
ncbi:hypothetical protein [Salegentibacter mishustinae]|uniref:Uncharacterized protein n=1 Tax=Salegentibacter mishustinae TaxID=270918 RepID=A0A0Q9Z5M8_9FLAO|nr:hypothetical protein [Salegentibacter mishustinae]KRG28230.1 hypothetical protein APR42_05435 [Salegentibacter mishustinae]PNW22165.1 hypothetical protein APB85_13200 [Salegentibacter mishustinae]PZX67381.1 hypothetical protein LY54_00111 [Salegentibacter mishustinae]GGW80149.1 hypothetical protein GCM10008086_04930 [Salegentibacter mishustinae]